MRAKQDLRPRLSSLEKAFVAEALWRRAGRAEFTGSADEKNRLLKLTAS